MSSINNAVKELQQYRDDINRKCDIFTERLAHEGVIIAKTKIMQFPAVYTGELLNSIQQRPGDILTNGATWYVYTDCPYAKYVEFGTGLIGSQNPHPDTSLANWKYDINNHGEAGWFYFNSTDGKWHWTKGMPSRPFMFETGQELHKLVTKIAKEVFGS